ncbi:Alpha-ketoglutarate-dependent sulfonate dioxygenase [Lachnellula hyalina]|uniref:Alpha-ketoglutarate-dependent sulfonate dioxygenase n=1 Tax=Lachnellula hyalina TaxID=1316788 RepID=A0A8H8U010_9HELO|nr:Alpha-ketoglutarate-dependent sulfonate dioxygenase [Lachnellula hyalina]TVY28749.1 Alpha-ketoglutarate-dependent sulfonate dioxygenase [Lachnellula hyalina]
MAPSAQPDDAKSSLPSNPDHLKFKRQIEIEGPNSTAKDPHYLPTWNPTQKYPPLEPFEYVERGKDADPSFKDLLLEGSTLEDITPSMGSEIHGVQLSKLTNAGKDQLALLVAQRKVVAFRDQDFTELPIKQALDFGGYFGRHHIHPTSGSPEGYPEMHIVHRGPHDTTFDTLFENRLTSTSWHSDVSNEKQPPGITFLYALETPKVGGDTGFANLAEAYNRLSPAIKERLHGLEAVHSGFEQAEGSRKKGGVVRREPVASVHPLVRTHPATGEKALFVNTGFTRNIVGLKKEESDALLKFLLDHISNGGDFQARVSWKPRTVVVWDNRVTSHTALLDWSSAASRRHLARITPQAEQPYETPYVK